MKKNVFTALFYTAGYFFLGTAFASQMWNIDRTQIIHPLFALWSFVWFLCGVGSIIEKSED